MTAHWTASSNSLEIHRMPFYWRLSSGITPVIGIDPHLAIRITANMENDYLRFIPTTDQWTAINEAYRQNANIGFLNPESGQMQTYGTSVNNFLLKEMKRFEPRLPVEIGCGAGFSIQFLKEYGYDVIGVDPSEYSLHWSERLGFRLINDFFSKDLLDSRPDFIYCNDVFEHVSDVEEFSSMVFDCLDDNGVFCIATTNSTRSIQLGDISMLEHQHVNMFTDRSILLILGNAGFTDVSIASGSYGNTFHITAVKRTSDFRKSSSLQSLITQKPSICQGYFQRAEKTINSFEQYYYSSSNEDFVCYVPLRCIPYLSCVGDFGKTRIIDSNAAWHGKYIDGYSRPIENIDGICDKEGTIRVFVGSLTFFDEIRDGLIGRGYQEDMIKSIESLA